MPAVNDIQKVRHFKYLGFTIGTTAQELRSKAKLKLEQSMITIGNRTRYLSTQAQKLIFQAFLRSHIVYQMTPLFATGLISLDDINRYETYCVRRTIGIPNDISSKTVYNVTNWSKRRASLVI